MTSARRYAREIEAAWTALLERPAVLGERDWSLICDWHTRGIPLALVREAFEQLAGTLRRRRSAPRNLGAVAPLVEEAWRTVRAGRAETPETAGATHRDPAAAWRRSAEQRPADDPLRAWILELVRGLGAGDSAERCETRLQTGLLERLPAALLEALSREVDAELEPFRGRMSGETWRATRRRALVAAARRRLGLLPLEPQASPRAHETS